MRLTTAIRVTLGTLLAAGSNVAQAQSDLLGHQNMEKLGTMAGRIEWAKKHCGHRTTAAYATTLKATTAVNQEAVDRGVKLGTDDAAAAAKKNGLEAACLGVRLMYGPRGFEARGMVE